MSSLIYSYWDNDVVVAMDSLCHSGDDFRPLSHLTKFLILPSIQGLICGTGLLDLILLWQLYLQKNSLNTSVKGIDRFATSKLQELAQPFLNAYPNHTTTLYHFGYDERENKFLGYAYRSKNDFKSEKLPHGIGIKPEFPGIHSHFEEEMSQEWIIKMVMKQKEYDDALPFSERVGIGGQVHLAIIAKEDIVVKTIYEFPDFTKIMMKGSIEP